MINGLEKALSKSEDLAEKIYWVLIYEGQYNRKFHVGNLITNTPTEVRDLIKKYMPYLVESK